MYDALLNAKIAINLHYIPVYRQPYYEAMGFKAGYCPEAERYHKESISLPIFPKLSAEQISNVVSVLVDILKYDN